MKRFLLMCVLAVAAVLLPASVSEAYDYYLGSYENGQVAYLVTDSMRWSNYEDGGDIYRCRVKAVDPDSDRYDIVTYEALYYQVLVLRKNGDVFYSWRMSPKFLDSHPVEKNLLEYIGTYREGQGKRRNG
jgi:hypothetical protein